VPASFDIDDLKIPEDSEYRQLLERCPDIEQKRFTDGEYLMREGEECKDVFLVLKGSYVVEQPGTDRGDKPPDALAVVSSTPDAPTYVGEMAYFGGECRSASVRSAMANYVLFLKPAHLDVIIDEFSLLTRILCHQFAERLRETSSALHNVQDRTRIEAEQVFAKAGQVLFEKGERAEKLYQLVDGVLLSAGAIHVKKLSAQDTFMGFIEAGPYFADGVYETTVEAETPAILVAISRASKPAVIRNYPELILELYQRAAKKT